MPIPALEDLGLPVPQKAHDINAQSVKLLHSKAGELAKWAANPDLIPPGQGLWDRTEDLLHDPKVMPDESDVFGLDFTQMPEDARIKIPTVHIYGAKDPRWPASVQLAHFCDNRKMYDHGGGHDIPRSSEVSNQIVAFVKQLEKDIKG